MPRLPGRRVGGAFAYGGQMAKDIASIADLTPDPKNANRGTERGLGMVEDSLRNYGAGRSILVDKDGVVIAGNKCLEAAAEIGLPVRVIKTNGSELIVVQREDLDLDDGDKARQLAYADNRSSQVGLDWDLERILADVEAGVDLSGLWDEQELARLLENAVQVYDVTATDRDGQSVQSTYGQMRDANANDRVHVQIGDLLETWIPVEIAMSVKNHIISRYEGSGTPHFEAMAAILEKGCAA